MNAKKVNWLRDIIRERENTVAAMRRGTAAPWAQNSGFKAELYYELAAACEALAEELRASTDLADFVEYGRLSRESTRYLEEAKRYDDGNSIFTLRYRGLVEAMRDGTFRA